MISDILIIVPVYNEESNIDFVIKDLNNFAKNIDILFINDSSTDATFNIITKNKYNVLNNEKNIGYFKSIQKGIKYAYDLGYNYVITFDGDGQHKANEIEKLINTMKSTKSDIVIGSRYIEKGYKQKLLKKIGVWISKKGVYCIYKKNITDATSGFKIFSRKVMKKIINKDNKTKYIDLNFILELLNEKYNIKEVAVKMDERKNGESMYKGFKKSFEYTFYMYKDCMKQIKLRNK